MNLYKRVRRTLGRPYHAVRRVIAPTPLERYWRQRTIRERNDLEQARAKYETLYANPNDTPLVTVTIATWNRRLLLTERALPSILAQSYDRFEVVIVGDHCTDDTESVLRKIGDPRIRWLNLPARGDYPPDTRARWQAGGAVPINEACRLAQGLWIAQLDDDDVFTADHIEALLRQGQAQDLEVACGVARREVAPGQWEDKGGPAWPGYLSVYGSALTRTYLRLFDFDINCWKWDLPGDKDRHYRMLKAGVRMGFLDRVVLYSPMRPGQTQWDHLAEDREQFAQSEATNP